MTQSIDTGCLADVPSALRAPGAAIGKAPDYDALIDEAQRRFPKVHRVLAANDNYPRVVAFTGLAGSGKSTATRYLVERHGYTLVKFAGPLKRMMYALGLTEYEVEGDLKELPQDRFYGKTPRYLMQTIGTDWARNMIGEDFWVRIWQGEVRALLDVGNRVVVDDCRFANEAAAIRALGGVIIKLEGRGGIAGAHQSEAGCGTHDAIVDNDGCMTELYADVEEVVQRWAA